MRVFKPTAVRAYPVRVVSVWKFNVTSKGVPVRRLRPPTHRCAGPQALLDKGLGVCVIDRRVPRADSQVVSRRRPGPAGGAVFAATRRLVDPICGQAGAGGGR